jgi:hypothetical protein
MYGLIDALAGLDSREAFSHAEQMAYEHRDTPVLEDFTEIDFFDYGFDVGGEAGGA